MIETQSTQARSRAEAERLAARWEAELLEGLHKPKKLSTWKDLLSEYEVEHLSSLKEKTRARALEVARSFENVIRPGKLSEISSRDVAKWQSRMRRDKLSESSIESNSSHLKALLNWGLKHDFLSEVPHIAIPRKSGRKMKGRPLSDQEIEQFAQASSKIIGEQLAQGWSDLILGLSNSGLRLSEALLLSSYDPPVWTDYSLSRPMIRILAEADKGGKSRLLPMAPEFASQIEGRSGLIFEPIGKRRGRASLENAGKILSKIGEASGIQVAPGKFASAHDLRRSFGFRWSRRVMPAVLKEIMRHEDISTTMQFYVGSNAEATAEELWKHE
ncbi:tyrosine-type recombinase/integrase [Thalassoglobus neptunius]|uniref:tyrosine-type recombinase/integrase n=1 Tax=Thalassoglobus neptunius TaxID=1938619 RepID=UPI0018D26455|nr:tyrosine-type recombinase/integrase [Thalassoglobus neptunius]